MTGMADPMNQGIYPWANRWAELSTASARLKAHRVAVAIALLFSVASAQAQLKLITDEEARLPDSHQLQTRAITRGPAVRLSSSSEVSAKGFPLKIQFEARGGAKIDVSSVKLEYLKAPIVDLTDRVRPYIKPDGLEIPSALVPIGEHAIRVSLKDGDGRSGTASFSIKVR
jgi:hypothetical protein